MLKWLQSFLCRISSRAEVEISVPLLNDSLRDVSGALTASFENVAVTKNVSLKPGQTK